MGLKTENTAGRGNILTQNGFRRRHVVPDHLRVMLLGQKHRAKERDIAKVQRHVFVRFCLALCDKESFVVMSAYCSSGVNGSVFVELLPAAASRSQEQ